MTPEGRPTADRPSVKSREGIGNFLPPREIRKGVSGGIQLAGYYPRWP